MDLTEEMVKTVVSGAVWIVAWIVIGRVAMFGLTRYFALRDRQTKAGGDSRRDDASAALEQMTGLEGDGGRPPAG